MPQVILQTAFLIRSANSSLRETDNSGTLLLLLSLIASVMSVANKYRCLDDRFTSRGLKSQYKGFKLKCRFPGCINWWYLLTAIWRYSHIITRFTVFSLIWGVCGGWWVGIFMVYSLLLTELAFILVFGKWELALETSQICFLYVFIPMAALPGINSHICNSVIGLLPNILRKASRLHLAERGAS